MIVNAQKFKQELISIEITGINGELIIKDLLLFLAKRIIEASQPFLSQKLKLLEI